MKATDAFVAALSCLALLLPSARAQTPAPPATINPVQELTRQLLLNQDALVFASKTFPAVDYTSHSEAEKIIGPYTVTTRYFSRDYKEVKDAAKVGRYGAIVEVRGANGQVRDTRYVTLYRAPTLPTPGTAPLPLAKEYGFSAQQIVAQASAVEEYGDTTRPPQNRLPLPVLLAGLSESRAGDPPVQRFSVRERDRRWWYEQKKRLVVSGPYRHLVQTPPDYEQGSKDGKKYPVLLFLHGSGERGSDLDRAGVHGPLRYIREGHTLPFIVVVPQCEEGDRWLPTRVIDLLNDITKKYRVDTSRVYLSGLSMGGYGTWATALEFPSRFAALLPVCGGGDPKDARRLIGMPVWNFHGDQDQSVPITRSVEMVEALKVVSEADVRFTVYPGVGHDSWTETYNNPAVYEWLLKYTRP